MAVNVITEFGANTKKFDAAVTKSSKKAKENLENIGKGARVAGGRIGEMSEKFNNLATGSWMTTVTAGIAVIGMALLKVRDVANNMFRGAAEDAKAMTADLASAQAVTAGIARDSAGAQATLRQAMTKKSLTYLEQVEVAKAISHLQQKTGVGGISLVNGQLTGYDVNKDQAISNKLIENELGEIDNMQKGLIREVKANKALYEQMMKWYNVGFASAEEAAQAAQSSTRAIQQMHALVARKNKLLESQKWVHSTSWAYFDDADAQRKAEAAAAAAADKAKREQQQREQRNREIKRLTEQKQLVSSRPAARLQSQVFTNELTSRGGWARGGKLMDNNYFQNQIMQHNQRQQRLLQRIEKRIQDLQRI